MHSDLASPPPLPQACSDKLKQEMLDFGYPPDFPVDEEEMKMTEEVASPTSVDPNKKVKKPKSKVAARSWSLKYQWQIMHSLGMSDAEVKE